MDPVLGAATSLFNKLNEQNIRYCHWKSNQHLNESLQGRTDFDLLVDRDQEETFRSILYEHCCKSILSPPRRQYPAIEDFLGYDDETGNCFHLHVHYQLILGEQFVKNYRIPLEKQFLDSTMLSQGVKIVTPDLEIIILTIRALLKYRDRDVVKDIFSIRSPGLPGNILAEFKYLLEHTTSEKIAETLSAKACHIISPEIVLDFLKIIIESPRQGYQLYQLRKKLRQELTPFERHTRREARKQYFQALWCKTVPFVCSSLSKKKPASGGLSIAFVGADGAGKSTTINAIKKWLSWKMDTQVVYMGSGQETTSLSQFVKFIRRLIGRIQKAFSLILGEKNFIPTTIGQLYRLTENYYHLTLAQTRYQRYLAGRRRAAQGAIVIYDRYPLIGIHQVMSKDLPPMDGPRIAWSCQNQAMNGITKRLSLAEEQFFKQITPPEYLVLLHVTSEVSQQRKPDHHREHVEIKIQAIEAMNRQGLKIIDIDATRPLDKTLRKIKHELWNIL